MLFWVWGHVKTGQVNQNLDKCVFMTHCAKFQLPHKEQHSFHRWCVWHAQSQASIHPGTVTERIPTGWDSETLCDCVES